MFDFIIDNSHDKEIELLPLYDLVIVGSGPGGCSAALYAKRKGLEVLLVTKEIGGQMVDSQTVENYLGTLSTTGEKLNRKFLSHLEEINVPILKDVKVNSIEKIDNLFHLNTNYDLLKAKAVIIATGASPKKLNVKGEDTFDNNGITYCAICDGPFYKNKDVITVGGGNPALEIAYDLAKITKSVTVIDEHNELAGDLVLVNKLKELGNVTFLLNTTVKEFNGNDSLENVVVYNHKTNKEKTIKALGAFIHIGSTANSKLVSNLVDINSNGEIITNNLQETSLKGLFAVGDVTNTPYKQIVIAESQGAIAALTVNEYLKKEDI